jgi:hypothetical protein
MMRNYPARVRIGVLCIVVFALLSSGMTLGRALDSFLRTTGEDEISHYEARLRLLKSALPSRGVIGYLSEPGLPPLFIDWARGFSLTGYVLAPLIVVNNTAPALVIGNFRSPGPGHTIPDPTLVPVRDFGDGVLLFRHELR